jgi:hypothetical protein
MALQQLFHCPNCNAGLDIDDHSAAIVRCDYCRSAVIVPESLRRTAGVKTSPELSPPQSSKPVRPAKPGLTQEEAVNKVTALAQRGQKIEAIKLYRENFPVGLGEAKEAVEQVEAGQPLPVPQTGLGEGEDLPLAAAEEITHLAATGQMAAAARLYRITFDTSQKQAEVAVQQLVEGKTIEVAQHKARQESQATAVRIARPPDKTNSQPGIFSIGLIAVVLIICLIVFGLAAVLFFI